jgi:cystathionine beta-lyase/cystathionine gamma-synthase
MTLSDTARLLSPRRKSTQAADVDSLVLEQLAHFGIDPATDFGKSLGSVARSLYVAANDVEKLWSTTLSQLHSLDRRDRIAWFNAKKFLGFQLAKLLDNVQNPLRRSYQGLGYSLDTNLAKGPYAPLDNVAAIFSATPVIARTATYIYACAEWIEDAFEGKELLLEIYSRLLNPTSIALANAIVDLECGPLATDYFAWNFGSGMAAIDAVLSHLLGRDDVLITSRNIYGGAHQLIYDWFAKPGNLAVKVEHFDGFDDASLNACLDETGRKYGAFLDEGRHGYVYLESPCNPHGDVLDVPAICRAAHARGLRVILDATVATPFLSRPLQHPDELARPDFVIHSYTKDLSGAGSVTGGVVIARNRDMFLPKGSPGWDQTLFWNVYYVKGGFLHPDSAYAVMDGLKTLEQRMLTKCINTRILSRFLASHPQITVNCGELESHPNHAIMARTNHLGLPAPLFTADFGKVPREAFVRFFDSLSPTFAHMISLGQCNTIISCPALTTHSELSESQQRAAGISPTMVRIAIGNENPLDLIDHLIATAEFAIDPAVPGFSSRFMSREEAKALVKRIHVDTHARYIEAKCE